MKEKCVYTQKHAHSHVCIYIHLDGFMDLRASTTQAGFHPLRHELMRTQASPHLFFSSFFFLQADTLAYMPVTVIHMIILLSEKETGSCQERQERRPHISPAVRGGEQTMTLT